MGSFAAQKAMEVDDLRKANAILHGLLSNRNAEIELLRAALKPFADTLSDREQEAHEALQVGGYLPCDDDFPIEVPCGWLRQAREALTDEQKPDGNLGGSIFDQ